MAEPRTLNTDLEQAVYKAALREKRLRHKAALSILLPLLVGGIWLWYSASEVDKWRTQFRDIEEREASVQQREEQAKHDVESVRAQLDKSELHARTGEEQQAAAARRADDMQQRLVKVRDEIGGLGVLLTDLGSARAKASKLAASEAVESQLSEIRGTLGRTLGRVEQQIDSALPPAEQKARVTLFIADDLQRGAANQLKAELETNGFDVAGISKTSARRIDATEVHYFREPQDKPEAMRLQSIYEKQSGETGSQLAYTPDPDQTSGSRKFQIWLGKTAPRPLR